jgi:hypothetical protein
VDRHCGPRRGHYRAAEVTVQILRARLVQDLEVKETSPEDLTVVVPASVPVTRKVTV